MTCTFLNPSEVTRRPCKRVGRQIPNTPRLYRYIVAGSVAGLTDGTELTDSFSYDAFGNERARTGTNPQPFRYLANAYDPTTKLYDFHARTYDPSAGRFTSKDPVRGYAHLPQTLNPHAYGRDNPFAYPDPSGRDTFGVCESASAGAGLGASVQKCYVTDLTTVKETTTAGI